MSPDQVTVRFDGKPITCRAGTSVAVALWEQGIRILSHSPKYGRPRGLHCGRGQCTSCLMRVDGVPNVRTCQVEVRDGMRIRRQDTGALYGPILQKTLDLGGSLFPVGFYYKWFTRPASLSRLFLKGLRPLTGVGRFPDTDAWNAAAPRETTADLGHVGRLVIGAGPAGLQAAAAAAPDTMILDEHEEVGGNRWSALAAVAGEKTARLDRFPSLLRHHSRLARQIARFESAPPARVRLGRRVVAAYAPNQFVVADDHGLAAMTCDELVWAAGGLDTIGLFPGNDVPSLFGPRALYRLVCRDRLDVAQRQAVIVGGGLDFWLAAALLHARGAHVSLVLTESGWQSEVSAAIDLGWQLHSGLELASARRAARDRLALTLVPPNNTSASLGSHVELGCDLAVICRRSKPVYDLLYQLGTDVAHYPDLGGYLPVGSRRGTFTGTTGDGLPLSVLGEAAGALPVEVLTDNLEVEAG